MAGELPPAKNKAELRTAVLKQRDELTERDASRGSHAVCTRLAQLDRLDAYQAIAGYASIRNEIDVTEYLRDRQEQGAQLYFPRVSGPAELEFVAVDDLSALEPGAFDVPEPDGPPADIEEIGLFLVPGVAFDRQGRRLGFGRGFYDRALERRLQADQASGPPLLVGICYHWQLLAGEIPVEPHDIAVDIIATDQELIEPSGRRST